MLKKKSDIELVELVKGGCHESFEELLSRYSSKAFSLATRLTGTPEDAEEVLQDVFITVFRKIKGFEGKSAFSSWFYRVTVNCALMKLRKRRQTPAVSLEEMIEVTHEAPVAKSTAATDGLFATTRSEVSEALDEAIRSLPEDYRPVFVLRDIDGLTSREVAKMLDLTVPAVKSRLHRSRLLLKKRLNGFYREYRADKYDLPEKKVGNL